MEGFNYGAHLSDSDLIVDWDHIQELVCITFTDRFSISQNVSVNGFFLEVNGRRKPLVSHLFVSASRGQDHSLWPRLLLALHFALFGSVG